MNAFTLGLVLVVAAPAPKEAPKEPTHVGDWLVESVMVAGQVQSVPPGMIIRLGADGKFERRGPDGTVVIGGTFTVDAKQTPAQIDIKHQDDQQAGPTSKSIFKLDGDTLTICTDHNDSRPKKFESLAGSNSVLMVLKRKKD